MKRFLAAAVILVAAAIGCTTTATQPEPAPTPRTSSVLPSLDSELIAAAWKNDVAEARRLITAGANVNAVDDTVQSAFLIAASEGYLELLDLTLQNGADIRSLDSYRGTALIRAAERGHAAAVFATERPAAPTASLLAAATAGDASKAAAALAAGAPLESRDGNRRTALLLASLNDRVDVARLLVGLGADPDAPDDRQDSAWLVTGVTGSVAMLETLLPAHPDLKLRNRFGGVSVIPASERGHVDYVRRVVETGIDVNHVNNLGWTALLEAIILGKGTDPWQQIVRILLAAGANPSLPDGDGVTPLQHARSRGYDEIAAILRAAGAR